MVPARVLSDGDFRGRVVHDGPWGLSSPPTSGNAWSRAFLEQVLPIPSGVWGDAYLNSWAYALGRVCALAEPRGAYRVHSQNSYKGRTFDERIAHDQRHLERCGAALGEYYRGRGIEVDVERWKSAAWQQRVYLSARELEAVIPPATRFILVDEDNWGTGGLLGGRPAFSFPERNGWFAGPPADTAAALAELERLAAAGARFIAFAWQAFWWLEHYAGLREHLRSHFRCVLENDRLVVFELAPHPGEA
jgi:hypothetical protein